MREFGLNLPYPFSWYVYGPYSTELARDLFDFPQFIQQLTTQGLDWGKIVDYGSSNLTKLQVFLDEANSHPLPPNAPNHYWLELLSGLHYLSKYILSTSSDKGAVFGTLTSIKPERFRSEDMAVAWQILQKHHLVI